MKYAFALWKKLDSYSQLIKSLWTVVAIMVFINMLLVVGWHSAPNRLTVYIPPDLSMGTEVKPNTIPLADVYAFAFQIFTALNTWSFEGNKDYPQAIKDYRFYMTPSFYHTVQEDYTQRNTDGSLARVRMVSGYTGMGYHDNSVKVLGKNTWTVNLTLHVIEQVGGAVVKDVLINYPVRVVRVQSSIALNPWGLAIDGFEHEPERVKTFI